MRSKAKRSSWEKEATVNVTCREAAGPPASRREGREGGLGSKVFVNLDLSSPLRGVAGQAAELCLGGVSPGAGAAAGGAGDSAGVGWGGVGWGGLRNKGLHP